MKIQKKTGNEEYDKHRRNIGRSENTTRRTRTARRAKKKSKKKKSKKKKRKKKSKRKSKKKKNNKDYKQQQQKRVVHLQGSFVDKLCLFCKHVRVEYFVCADQTHGRGD